MTLFNGTWLEAALGALMGLVVALINTLVSSRFPQSSNLLEFVCGLVVSLLTGAIQRAGGLHAASGSISSSEETIACVGHLTIVLSGLAVLLPGLSLTSAITEISLRNMTSGTVRLFHALFTAMMLGFGISVGTIFIDGASSNSLLLQTCAHEPTSLPHGSVYPLLLLPLTLCINLFFQAPLKHWPIMMVSSAAGFSAMFVLGKVLRIDDFSSSSSTVMPVQMGVTAAAAVIGLVSNVYARWVKDADGVAAMLSGIFLLVPGSMGVRASLGFFTPTDHSNSADNNNAAAVVGAGVAEGCAFVVQMLIVGLSLTVGLFVAGILVSPVQVSVAEDHDGGPGPATDVERTETSKRKRIKKRRILSTV